LWISSQGQQAQQIFDQKASSPIWDPNNYLLFFSGNKIYRTNYPDYTKVSAVATLDASVQEVMWMEEK
jgi:DNA-binding beta-propeller fold protein YncE